MAPSANSVNLSSVREMRAVHCMEIGVRPRSNQYVKLVEGHKCDYETVAEARYESGVPERDQPEFDQVSGIYRLDSTNHERADMMEKYGLVRGPSRGAANHRSSPVNAIRTFYIVEVAGF